MQQISNIEKEFQIKQYRELAISSASKSFYAFCHILAPDFYTKERTYLRVLCDTLQALYESRIVRLTPESEWIIVPNKIENVEICKNFMINMPPRHGKSRTLIMFAAWVFGRDRLAKIITASYSDDSAITFSKYTRDLININDKGMDESAYTFVYNEIFPKTKLKIGDSGKQEWALSGTHFSYRAVGIGGGITGKGANILMVDDPVKDAEESFSATIMEKLWLWYTGTFLSRKDKGEPIQIINHTRWSNNDLSGRILKIEPRFWYVLKLPAYNESTNTMLCEDLYSLKSYQRELNVALSNNKSKAIFLANYQQQIIDVGTILYSNFQTYEYLPKGNFTTKCYVDWADTGEDYFCGIVYNEYQSFGNKFAYIIDILYTQEPNEITEPKLAEMLIKHKVLKCIVESNSGGRSYMRALQNIVSKKYKRTQFVPFTQKKNKEARIMEYSALVQTLIYLPNNWEMIFKSFAEHLTAFQFVIAKNKYKDCADAMTGVCEDLRGAIHYKVRSGYVSY